MIEGAGAERESLILLVLARGGPRAKPAVAAHRRILMLLGLEPNLAVCAGVPGGQGKPAQRSVLQHIRALAGAVNYGLAIAASAQKPEDRHAQPPAEFLAGTGFYPLSRSRP